jgi:Na+/melibiose symporter-like transporter
MSIQSREKFFYASGAVANGVKGDAFTFFLLFFYSNVIGLTPGLASLAIFIALMIDAFTDPIMGVISDRTNHRLGRRHPYFLLGIIPYGTFLLHAFFNTRILGVIPTTIILLDA